MVTVSQIFDLLSKKFPLDNASDFDNVGLLVGEKSAEINCAVVALDCDINTLDFAKEKGAKLIITHHPVIFEPIKSVTESDIVYKLIKNGISVISMHTNMDIAKDGVNDALCEALNISPVKEYTADDGFILRSGAVSTNADKLAKSISLCISSPVRYVSKGEIKKVLVCSGSGGDYIDEAIKNGFDALITGECKHHHFIKAINSGVALFECGHYESENVIIKPLAALLSEKFKDIEFLPFENHEIKCVF